MVLKNYRNVQNNNNQIVGYVTIVYLNMSNDSDPRISKRITTLYKHDTEFSADSVEWCPHKPNQNFFVCGNYQLAEDESNEKGTFKLFIKYKWLKSEINITLIQ